MRTEGHDGVAVMGADRVNWGFECDSQAWVRSLEGAG
jgi:hypothetical protein